MSGPADVIPFPRAGVGALTDAAADGFAVGKRAGQAASRACDALEADGALRSSPAYAGELERAMDLVALRYGAELAARGYVGAAEWSAAASRGLSEGLGRWSALRGNGDAEAPK